MRFLISLLIIIIFIQSISAITVSSENYSVGMVGMGILAESNPASGNYEATALSEVQGTTRNAESGTYTTNVGFFENVSYYRAVSITSYSIYPKSSTAVSVIKLYISALNYQAVWATITRPDGVNENVVLSNNDYKYYIAGIVGRYNVTFYANNTMGSVASIVDYFDITSQVTPSPTSGGGGGSTTIVEKNCTYNWDCTPWSVCSDGKQTRECKNIGTCAGAENKPIQEMKCSEALFDIVLKLKDIKLTEKKLNFKIDLVEKIGVEKIDTYIKYSIINSNNTEIFSRMETIAIKGNITLEKEISEIKLSDGDYILRIDVLYGNLQRAFTEQRFTVKGEKIQLDILEHKFLILAIVLLSLLIILIIRKRRKNLKRRVHLKKHLPKQDSSTSNIIYNPAQKQMPAQNKTQQPALAKFQSFPQLSASSSSSQPAKPAPFSGPFEDSKNWEKDFKM